MFPYKMDIFKVSIAASLVSALSIIGLKQYFIYIPFANGVDFLSILGFLALIGWIFLVLLPPIFLANTETWSITKNLFFLVSVSLWTLATLSVKIYTLFAMGRIWAEYLLTYPIFIFLEWLLPAFYIFVGLSLLKHSRGKNKTDVKSNIHNQQQVFNSEHQQVVGQNIYLQDNNQNPSQ